jgi:hypothetical protein
MKFEGMLILSCYVIDIVLSSQGEAFFLWESGYVENVFEEMMALMLTQWMWKLSIQLELTCPLMMIFSTSLGKGPWRKIESWNMNMYFVLQISSHPQHVGSWGGWTCFHHIFCRLPIPISLVLQVWCDDVFNHYITSHSQICLVNHYETLLFPQAFYPTELYLLIAP